MARMVQKTTTFERFVHWVLAISGLLLLFTGFGFLYAQELGWINKAFGGQAVAMAIHNWGGVVFTGSLLLSMGLWLGEALSFSKEDSEWLGMMGGYFSKGSVPPPAGKMNAGQKLSVICVVVFGLLISVSGFIIWLSGTKGSMNIGVFLHNISAMVFAVLMPLHIYLATAANPGTFRIMTKGDVPLYWAKKKHAKWVKELGLD